MSATFEHPGIVVGVDGSGASRSAVCWAARDAAMRHISLTLVHVVQPICATWPQTPAPIGLGQWQEQQGRAFLDAAIKVVEASIRASQPVPVNTEIFFSAPVPTLVDLSKDADMVVVGSRGEGPLGGLLGSVSSGMIHHSHCPVAVIREEAPLMPQHSDAPVLVGIDGSPASELATAIAFDEASRRRVDLIALHAWSDTVVVDFPGIDWDAMKSAEEGVLAERLAGWRERYPDVTVHRLVICDRPARQLVEHSKSAQLVVVGSRGRGGFAGMLLGSVSTAVVHSTRTPVIVARES